MNWTKKIIITGITILVLFAGGFGIWLSNQHVVPIMMYHNVANSETLKANTVSPQRFERHMEYLKQHRFNVIGFDLLVLNLRENKPLPKKSVVITFDDGYEDNYTNAYPILKKYGYPAIMFIPSDLIGNEGYLTWGQVREMAANGITFASHSRHHEYLPDLPEHVQRDEIYESKRILEQRLGRPINYFAYPIGGFNDTIKKMVRNAGYIAAVTTNRGFDRRNKNVYELNRIRFSDKDDRDSYLWIKLSGYYNVFREPKKPH